ncbi:hypothetical protein J2S78_002783 [Salibacterium salarium]|uniref:hypothetical protein n=1 Tax=Salibacterium salarium TaxID=284579 RepID=UPI0027824B31|nr:hypothetical protein [Salibacterium salarium]MDQ0300336.1 hypothetical protein [Salibacterium salarium]
MSHKKKNPDHQFKENANHGEHRNGRLSQFKNNSAHGGEIPNEYVSHKENEDS